MKASVYTDRATLELRETKTPVLNHGDVLLKVAACGVCGTDVRKVRHALIKSPTVLGHEVAGTVAAVGDGVTKFRTGDRVVVAHHTPCYVCHYCRHENFSMCRLFKSSNLDPGGFAEFVRIPARHVEVTAHKIPDGLTFEQAIFMEPLACVVRNLKRTTVLPGDCVVVIGLGSMGLFTGQMAKHKSARVIGTDLKEDRRNLALQSGFDLVLDGADVNLAAVIKEQTEGRGADLVVLTAGNAAVYSQAVEYLRDGGTLSIFAGLAPGERISYDANELYSREITLYSSYSPSPAELIEALTFLENGTVNVELLRANYYSLGEVGMAMDEVYAQTVMKAIISPHPATHL